ncbi:MAG: 23S rRNA (guanosine(2251)-2'-O)-methyltransferase RlmB [Oscillospiraceae bacterium]
MNDNFKKPYEHRSSPHDHSNWGKGRGRGSDERERNTSAESDEHEGYIEGRNAVTEALKAGHPLNKVYVSKGDIDASLRRIISMAKDAGAVVIETDRRKLDSMSATGAHQGIIAAAAVKEYCSVKDILKIADERGEAPLIIVCDEVSDAHNLGAIIRTAEAAGAHGVIIPKRRSAGLSAIISKTSAGAIEYMSVARVPNLTAAIKELKDNGVWIYGTAADGESDLWHTDLSGPMALVIGSEGDGMRRLVSESCDFRVSIPMKGEVSSLNASASAAVVIYEAVRQRALKK